MKKKITLSIIVILVVFIVFNLFFKKEEVAYTTAKVQRGEIVQEISETGQVKKGDKIDLSFKSAGKIKNIYVEVGQAVTAGQILAKLDTAQLEIQLQEAESALVIAQAKLDKLLAGASAQEIKVAQTNVDNKEIALNTAEQNLADAYEDALNTLEDAYLKAYNAQNSVDSIQRSYFTKTDQEGLLVKGKEDEIRTAVSQIKSSLDTAKEDEEEEDIETALSGTKERLAGISDALKIVRETCEVDAYRDVVSSTDKTSLDTQRSTINSVRTDIINAQQTIISKELAVSTAQGNLQAAEDDLSLLLAPARQEDVVLYQAQLNQAQAQVDILEDQIEDAYLRSPLKGQIAEVEKRLGETVQLQATVITLLPADPYKIEVDIYEEDVVKVKVDNPVDISLIAFPDEVFLGRVVSIDPAEKLVEGVVYYEVTIVFEETPEEIRPGMTADLTIKVSRQENVLLVPEDAIQKKNGQEIVEVLKDDGLIEKREVEIGLVGSDDMVEVISGLLEGEEVVIE